MSEDSFARAFLTSIERKPIRLSSDHVSDPKKYPAQSPVSGILAILDTTSVTRHS